MSRQGYDREIQLSSAMQAAIKTVLRGSLVIDGVIESVDEEAFTCDVKVGDSTGSTTYFDVPLRVLISAQASVIEIPKIGTNCIICFRDGNLGRPQILIIHEALKILVNCDNIVFNGGQLGGMVKVQDLVSKLNTIEQDLNTLKNVFANWSPVPNDGGAALKTAAGTWYGQQLTPTQEQDIENPKIVQ
jgi:hypothetical protein